jgi:VWFA-related protein
VATFNTSFSVLSWFHEDRSEAIKKIEGISSKGGTALYKALWEFAVSRLGKIEGRKALVVFTDGGDNSIQMNGAHVVSPKFESLLRDIEAIDSLVYLIHLTPALSDMPGASAQALHDFLSGKRQDLSPSDQARLSPDLIEQEVQRELRLIADQTGGRLFTPTGLNEIEVAYAQVMDDLRVQYSLGYVSNNAAKKGQWREIKVLVPGRHPVVVRTRKGYYLPR